MNQHVAAGTFQSDQGPIIYHIAFSFLCYFFNDLKWYRSCTAKYYYHSNQQGSDTDIGLKYRNLVIIVDLSKIVIKLFSFFLYFHLWEVNSPRIGGHPDRIFVYNYVQCRNKWVSLWFLIHSCVQITLSVSLLFYSIFDAISPFCWYECRVFNFHILGHLMNRLLTWMTLWKLFSHLLLGECCLLVQHYGFACTLQSTFQVTDQQ